MRSHTAPKSVRAKRAECRIRPGALLDNAVTRCGAFYGHLQRLQSLHAEIASVTLFSIARAFYRLLGLSSGNFVLDGSDCLFDCSGFLYDCFGSLLDCWGFLLDCSGFLPIARAFYRLLGLSSRLLWLSTDCSGFLNQCMRKEQESCRP